ncbi:MULTISPECIES: glycosyltransferase family 4 protein [unclassified Brenneria]|uniref:glycosyltransferase family 4 protein n=1 Tax=unclassified Brenneria TaxID=2634434 RepID=UPI00155177ED|nr:MULTISPECIES: glycosyltransferase family 4 protein [unclassified Brenneria]MBJ7223407.1 glycosyltransferase family 4 protein [Brenneria sp. L3-3C-1]MEE3644647.1 glycosyltransferase family 4 protein [Brenneria sp. L3_3C_1]MEE3652209.1 glycosyltransferase family 4 protein [Brenneria sp. HEZEL_4_2_4]NPD02168.1 glycosyltransferase family 4 protein [Brenneria sp. hezel4-2-4]
MIIAFCLYKYFPFGGLQRDFLRIAQACQARGHHIRVYVQSWEGSQIDNFELIQVPVRKHTNHARNKEYYQWIQQHMQQHPVDRIVGFNKMPGLDFYYAADVCYAEKVAQEKGFLYRLTSRYRHYAAFEKAVFERDSRTKMLMLTHRQIDDFKKHYGTQDERFVILPPGISPDRKYRPDAAQVRTRFRQEQQIPQHSLVVLQVGSDFYRKGVERSLYAIASLPETQRKQTIYLVVGQDKPGRYQKIASRLGISAQVRFFSGRNDIPDFMAAADLLIHPAHQEAAGIVLLEALTAGLPVIVTDVCGYAFYIDRANAGAVIEEPYRQNELNAVLHHALSQTEERTQWAANARHFADTADLYSLPEKAAALITGDPS